MKVATSENDLGIKAKRASSWLAEGHRIKLELFLPGRTKYLDEKFLKERLGRILKLFSVVNTKSTSNYFIFNKRGDLHLKFKNALMYSENIKMYNLLSCINDQQET